MNRTSFNNNKQRRSLRSSLGKLTLQQKVDILKKKHLASVNVEKKNLVEKKAEKPTLQISVTQSKFDVLSAPIKEGEKVIYNVFIFFEKEVDKTDSFILRLEKRIDKIKVNGDIFSKHLVLKLRDQFPERIEEFKNIHEYHFIFEGKTIEDEEEFNIENLHFKTFKLAKK